MTQPSGEWFRDMVDEAERQPPDPPVGTAAAEVFNAMTVDVEDYFVVTNFEKVIRREQWSSFKPTVEVGTRRVLELFARADVRATFFVLGWIAERWPQVVRAIDAAGHEVASHGYWHRRVFEHPPEEFRQDVRRAKNVLEDLIGRPVVGHRAPTFSIDHHSLWALDILLEEGYEYDSSLYPGRIYRPGFAEGFRQPHNIDRGDFGLIREIPMTSLRVAGTRIPFAGGGFFRLYPYPFIRWGMRRINRVEGVPVIVYFHPWEFAPEQPRVRQAPLAKRFKHYVNLRSFPGKIERMLGDFRFKTCAELIGDYRL
jgi:polysaccharide deacetylase family protein (PEP-CTERM system associated)